MECVRILYLPLYLDHRVYMLNKARIRISLFTKDKVVKYLEALLMPYTAHRRPEVYC